jgi:hypothetical protein
VEEEEEEDENVGEEEVGKKVEVEVDKDKLPVTPLSVRGAVVCVSLVSSLSCS